MAITKLTNTQIHTIVNEAYKQAVGKSEVDTIDLTNFTDTGDTDPKALRERFTKALIGVITKNWFLDSSYRSEFNDVFYEDASRFGAIIQAISIEAPEVKENSAWKDFVSGTTTVGTYTVYLPVVKSQYFSKTVSWALPVTISGEQWDTAFRSVNELHDFVSYVYLVVDNALVQHIEDLNAENRNNFIAEKIHYASTEDATGVHVVNLVEAFAKDRGATATDMSVSDFLASKDAMLYASEQIGLYSGYMRKQTSIFNTAGKVRFTPKERLVVQLLDAFEKRMDTVAMSDTFHNELLSLPLHSSVAAWQNMNALDFENLSTIDVKTADGNTVTTSGVVGLVCDKWAIVHTIKSNRVATQHFDIENLTHMEYQHRDAYMNNLTMNAVVFVLKDYTAPTT